MKKINQYLKEGIEEFGGKFIRINDVDHLMKIIRSEISFPNGFSVTIINVDSWEVECPFNDSFEILVWYGDEVYDGYHDGEPIKGLGEASLFLRLFEISELKPLKAEEERER